MESAPDQTTALGAISELDMCRRQFEEQSEKLKPFFRMCDPERPFIRELLRLSALKGGAQTLSQS